MSSAALQLSLYYNDFPTNPPQARGGRQTRPVRISYIEPDPEDYQGIRTLLNRSVIAAMLMVDFWYVFRSIYQLNFQVNCRSLPCAVTPSILRDGSA